VLSIAFNILGWISVAVWSLVLINLLINFCCVKRLLTGVSNTTSPYVSVLVPARNEADRIVGCLRSLQAQNYPHFEVLVLDDQSTDGTPSVVLGLGFTRGEGTRFRLLDGKPIVSGWTGKSWACQQLAEQARGEFLLFTDADTRHEPALLGAVVEEAARTKAGLLTLWPEEITLTLAEKLTIPLLFVAAAGFIPHWLLEYCQRNKRLATWLGRSFLRQLGTANGQFLFFDRSCYEQIGRHRAVANHLVEDVALGRLVAERTQDGLRLIGRDGTRLIRCRMYTSLFEVWEGFSKNARPLFEGGSGTFLFWVIFQTSVAIVPFFVWPFGRIPAMLLAIFLILLVRALTALRFKTSWLSVLLHPLAYLFCLAIALNSCRLLATAGVTWKGRVYQPAAESRSIENP
jgi:chlorobactene glucosyltransferase